MSAADRVGRGLAALALCMIVVGCGRGVQKRRATRLTAYCEAMVLGIGKVEVETDYIPHVVQCENGAAGFEALKAQAVAARSYLYYRLDRTGTIDDSTGDQVYSCGQSPSMLAYQAAEATSGQVLMYESTQVAGFYVAGAKQDPPECRQGDYDPTTTEHYVTYNAGRRGGDVEQTPLGWLHPDNHANRGCKSQNGSACLADLGWRYDQILRFYYGDDIGIVQADGPCITPVELQPSGPAPTPAELDQGCGCGVAPGPGGAGLVLGALAYLVLARRPRRR